jgi:cytochrome P450
MRSEVLPLTRVQTAWGPVWRIHRYVDVKRFLADTRFQPIRPTNAINMMLAEGRFEEACRARDEAADLGAEQGKGLFTGDTDVVDDIGRGLRLQIMSSIAAPSNVRRRTADMELLAGDVAEQFAGLTPPASLSSSYSAALCARAMCVLLGVSPAESSSLAVRAPDQDPVAVVGIAKVAAKVRELIARRRRDPQPDVISELLADERAADPRHASRFANVLTWVLMPSNWEVPATVIDSGVSMLLADPVQRQLLAADPALYPDAVEEILRLFMSPEAARGGLVRVAAESVGIDGTQIPAGALVQFDIAAANRDEQIFSRPAEFDITRNPNPHLTFGAGPHMCRFISMSRCLISTGITSVLRTFPGLRQAQPPPVDGSAFPGGQPGEVWVSW